MPGHWRPLAHKQKFIVSNVKVQFAWVLLLYGHYGKIFLYLIYNQMFCFYYTFLLSLHNCLLMYTKNRNVQKKLSTNNKLNLRMKYNKENITLINHHSENCSNVQKQNILTLVWICLFYKMVSFINLNFHTLYPFLSFISNIILAIPFKDKYSFTQKSVINIVCFYSI